MKMVTSGLGDHVTVESDLSISRTQLEDTISGVDRETVCEANGGKQAQ
jgi:hypothetical protein